MTFLNPYALWSAAVFLPLLVVLYFLKLRRTEVTVSSTFLWRRSIQDLHVNSLFQKLRRNILLLLQALFIACAVFAAAAPGCEGGEAGDRSVVILIDCSASMGATDVSTPDEPGLTRLDLMKQEAAKLIRGLWTREEDSRGRRIERRADEAMIIAFSDRAEVVAPFSRDANSLLAALDRIRIRHTATDFPAALRRVQEQAESRRNAPHIYIFTDGKVGRAAELAIAYDKLEILTPPPVPGRSNDNLAITRFSAVRGTVGTGALRCTAVLSNCADREQLAELKLFLDDRPVPILLPEAVVPARRKLETAPGEGDGSTAKVAEYESGSLSIGFELPDSMHIEGKRIDTHGMLRLEITRADALDLDNRAWAPVAPAHRPKGLLATAGPVEPHRSPVVAGAMAVDFARITVVDKDSFRASLLEPSSGGGFDFAVFDGFTPSGPLPPGRYLMLGALPPIKGVKIKGEVGDPWVLMNWVHPSHKMLRSVKLDGVSVFRALDWDPPAHAEILAEGLAGKQSIPLLTELVHEGSLFVTVGFNVNPRLGNVVNTDWWVQPWFAVFLQNAVLYLGGSGSTDNLQVEPGRPIDASVERDATAADITPPDGKVRRSAAHNGRIQYAETDRVGVYSVKPDKGPAQSFAVNLFDPVESDISPAPDGSVHINHKPEHTAVGLDEQRTDVWRWFLWGGLALLLLEWYIWNRKVHI